MRTGPGTVIGGNMDFLPYICLYMNWNLIVTKKQDEAFGLEEPEEGRE